MRSLPLRFAALLALAAASPAHADNVWCVNNTTSFQQALESARDDDTTIKLVRGHYRTFGIAGGTPGDGLDHDLTILGGYADGSCAEAGRSLDPALTVFEPFTPGGAYGFDLALEGDLLLKSITLRGYGYGVDLENTTGVFSADDTWTLDRVRIEASGGLTRPGLQRPSSPLYVFASHDADVNLRQVVVVDNPTTECALVARIEDQALAVVQSTFARNGGTGLCVHGAAGQSDPVDIDNNIFWGSACGLKVFGVPGSALHLRHNTIDCNSFDNLPSVNIGNDSNNPQFLDPANGDYRLALTSPAVDAGVNPPTGGQSATDITGGPRVIGNGVDRGPWETNQSSASVLIVGNTNNDGPGSLFDAIDKSNTLPGAQVIRFDIPGACPRIITLTTNLPDISDSVRIEGYSQPGSAPGVNGPPTICVGLWGNQTLDVLLSVLLNGDVSLDVSGLGFGGTSFNAGAAAIRLANGHGHQIAGNQFGGSIGPAGNPVALNALQHGVAVTLWAREVYIGGDDPAQRNYFNSANSNAINISSTATHPAGVRVFNNFIGPKPNGIVRDANAIGIGLNQTDGNFVVNNWISGNTQDGVVVFGANARDNLVVNNDIGRCPGCLTPPGGSEILMGNGSHGVRIQGGAHDNTIALNRIAGNGGAGIVETDDGRNNRFVSNGIYRNAALGIDVNGDGVTPNNHSITDGDGVQNFPLPGVAGGGFYAGSVTGSLNAPPNRDYTIQLFQSNDCDASGYGEGQRLVGAAAVTTPASPIPGLYSTVPFTIPVRSTGLDGKAITAIAIDADGNTSEFSPCVTYVYSDIIFQNGFD